MSNEYFKTALLEFPLDFASGGEIRAFADKGYTVSQIKEKLTFPTPIEEVRRVVWKHYIYTGVIKPEEPDSDTKTERVSYEKVQDSLGRTSFIQVTKKMIILCVNVLHAISENSSTRIEQVLKRNSKLCQRKN